MKIKVIEGRLAELPSAADSGVERRAFGEFVGPRGELASYALGWTTGADPQVARLSIGIGAGNPSGGTFHAAVFVNDGDLVFALTDEPFERVPEGGPHLTADQARAHEDLPFVWWVADHVMQRDRRATWMYWLLGTPCIQTRQVAENREPVLLVVHEQPDPAPDQAEPHSEHGGFWQLIGISDAAPDGVVEHLHHAIDVDATLLDILDLPPGYSARRTRVGGPWSREAYSPE